VTQHSDEIQIARIKAVAKRYLDAYRIARVTVGFGSTIKGIGAVLAVLLVLGAFLILGLGRLGQSGLVVLIMVAIIAGIVWLVFYVLGVLVSAQGQILLASLDGAVHSSPFLFDDEKAQVMKLPMPKQGTVVAA
jgi:hypothetical protein